ncbi:MAG: hypothetical protein ABII25_04950 [bacterium]
MRKIFSVPGYFFFNVSKTADKFTDGFLKLSQEFIWNIAGEKGKILA